MRESTQRAEGLVELSREVSSRETSDPSKAGDVLRAAVVLIHAYLEDFLRTLARALLPGGDESCLNDVPLAGSGSSGRAEKFYLGKLAQHKGKSVDQVIQESIAEYLDRSTFNNVHDIAQLLTRLGFNLSDHNQEFPTIQKMMQRRHQIVHQADRVKALHSDTFSLQPIAAWQVQKWLEATQKFLTSLWKPLLHKLNAPAIDEILGSEADEIK